MGREAKLDCLGYLGREIVLGIGEADDQSVYKRFNRDGRSNTLWRTFGSFARYSAERVLRHGVAKAYLTLQ